MAAQSVYFYQDFSQYEENAVKKNFKAGSELVLQHLFEQFSTVDSWEAEPLHQIVLQSAEQLQLGLGKIAQPLRIAVCGSGVSPAIDITLTLLGQQKTLQRIQKAIEFIKTTIICGQS
jgi:glutamyl-tRNA synthetase